MKRLISLFSIVLPFLSPAAFTQVIGVGVPPIVAEELPPLTDFRNNPLLSRFDKYFLTIPFIDHDGIPGYYQDATVEYSPQTQAWRLAGFTKAIPVTGILDVELVVAGQTPQQVFLDVTGEFGNGCLELGEPALRQHGPSYTVQLSYRVGIDWLQDCTDNVVPFRKVIPLPVYGLRAGTYDWILNGEFSGSFTLAADNVFAPSAAPAPDETSQPPPALYVPGVAPVPPNPVLYDNGDYLLALPLIDYDGKPGAYQDAVIEYAKDARAWQLSEYRQAVPVTEIEDVAVSFNTGKPAQVVLTITGTFTNGCAQAGDVAIQRSGAEFIVYLYYQDGSLPGPDHSCGAQMTPFLKSVALPVYGLAAGTYAYTVNGEFSRTFTLATDNVLE